MELNGVDLPGDSFEYDILHRATIRIKGVPGMTCELGVRRGGGSSVIIDSLLLNSDYNRYHICIDPYGNIDYAARENVIIKCDYTNQMRNDCLKNMFTAYQRQPINILFFILEDSEFFSRYGDGVPVYNQNKQLLTQYALVHFDGPHTVDCLINEIDFFKSRVVPGTVFVFDDILDYNHNTIEQYVLSNGFELIEKGRRKASYVKWK